MRLRVDLPEDLLDEAKRVADREGTTLASLIESGLRAILRERFRLRDASFPGTGLAPEHAEADWNRIREAAYESRAIEPVRGGG